MGFFVKKTEPESMSKLSKRAASLSTPALIEWMGQGLNDQAMALRAIEAHLSPEGIEEMQRAVDVQQALVTELRFRRSNAV